jgi:hypothetical protein
MGVLHVACCCSSLCTAHRQLVRQVCTDDGVDYPGCLFMESCTHTRKETRDRRTRLEPQLYVVCVSVRQCVCVEIPCDALRIVRCPTATATTTITKAHTTLPRYPTLRTGFFPAGQKSLSDIPHFLIVIPEPGPYLPVAGKGNASQTISPSTC